MQFERGTKKMQPIALTSLIDVVFLLLFFFMMSSSFVRTESMELVIPNAQEVKKEVKTTDVRVVIADEDRLFLNAEEMKLEDLRAQLRLLLFENPDRPVLLLSGDSVTVQRLVSIMDDIYLMGGRNVSVASLDPGDMQALTQAGAGRAEPEAATMASAPQEEGGSHAN